MTSSYHYGYIFLLVFSFVPAYFGCFSSYMDSSISFIVVWLTEYAVRRTTHAFKHWRNHLASRKIHFRLKQMVQMKPATRIRISRWENLVNTLKSLKFGTTILINIKWWQRKHTDAHTYKRRRNLSTTIVHKRKCATNDNVPFR